MREKDMSVIWGKYVKSHPPKRLETYELKMTKKKSVRYDAVAEHQIRFLQQSNFGLYYKITDTASADGFSAKKPFDCLYMIDAHPYVVVWFYKPRQAKVFHKIDLITYCEMMKCAKRKSFREEDLIGKSEQILVT